MSFAGGLRLPPIGIPAWLEKTEQAFSARFAATKAPGTIRVKLNGAQVETKVPAGATEIVVGKARVAGGAGRLEAELESGGQTVGVHYVTVRE